MANFILVDGSYYCFFRYFAILQWFKLAKPEISLDNPINNDIFVEKFKKTFIEKFQDISKKLNIDDPIIIVGKDCKRKNIWRMKLFPEYKANRSADDSFMGGPFFKMVYDNDIFKQAGSKLTLSYDTLEADDCIAITVKHILNTQDDANIWIITSDMDYLQLVCDKVKIYNLKYKNITDSKTCFKDPKKDLFCKIVSGDKSDGIPPVFKKCGIKTAEKYWHNKELFKEKLEGDPDAIKQYELNKKIIDFNSIPTNLVNGFETKYGFINTHE